MTRSNSEAGHIGEQGERAEYPGVQVMQVDPPEEGDTGGDRGVDLVLVRNVRAERDGLGRQRARDVLRAIDVGVHDDQPSTLIREPLGAGPADAAGAARNQGDRPSNRPPLMPFLLRRARRSRLWRPPARRRGRGTG